MSGLTREQAEAVLKGIHLHHARNIDADIIAAMMGETQRKPRRMRANVWPNQNDRTHAVEHDEIADCHMPPYCVPVDALQSHPIKTGFIPSTPPRDWTKEIEAGDEFMYTHQKYTCVTVSSDHEPVCGINGAIAVGAAMLVEKRPDRPGDGFEIIGREREGVYRWEGTVADHGKGLLLMYTVIDRSKLRRVYAVRD